MQDQATSSIIFIDDTSDDNNDERIAKVSNYTATNIQDPLQGIRIHRIDFKELLQELSISIRKEIS
ncbi:9379_t:CDS:2 [Funneliformis geosporum]|uniref:9379_t:CDS:1 n=1 Tax=Funneliformis geosporum TaxID=1117311 RepID=A0A9W4WY42_9GLOM|nr:9379_t:CDS:2 [Funneliformis geosporum]